MPRRHRPPPSSSFSSSSSASRSFCYVSRKQIEQASPSRQHGIDARREERLRRSYSVFLQDLGKALELPQQPTIAAATILCHRFFLRQSHATNDRFLVASACLFLAAKSEDTPCPLAKVVAAACCIRHNKDPAALDHETELLLLAEHLVLSTLDFDLAIDHPYKPLVAAIRKLKEGHGMQKELTMLGERLSTSKQEVQMASEHVAGQFQERKPAPDYVVFLPKAEDHVGAQCQAGKAASYHVGGHHKAGDNLDHVVRQYKMARITSDYVGGQFTAEKHACDHVHAHYKSGENAFQQVAWNFVNDGMLTSLCLQLKPHHIAAGAIYLAAKFLGVKLPCEGERMWWREFDVTPLQLEEVGNQILEVYVMEGPTFSESASSSDLNSSGVTSHSISEKHIQQKAGHGSNEGENDCNRGRNYKRRYY